MTMWQSLFCQLTQKCLNNRNFVAVAANRRLYFCFNLQQKKSYCSIRMENGNCCNLRVENSDSRGALIVLEGLDRSGKSSQSNRLLSYLDSLGHAAELWRFPDRTTSVGQMISAYLSNKSQLDDHTIHLLFSANRWEKSVSLARKFQLAQFFLEYLKSFCISLMENQLKNGTTLIVDRYSYSGVAFSSAKGLDVEWCKAPEVGLLAPDLVVYLDIPPEKAAERGGYGGERYEQVEFQRKVAQYYQALRDSSWKIIDACQAMEDVEQQLQEIVSDHVIACKRGRPLSYLWLC